MSKVSKDEFEQWLYSSPTKILLLQLEIDLETIKDNWQADMYKKKEELKAKGQAQYINGLISDIRELITHD